MNYISLSLSCLLALLCQWGLTHGMPDEAAAKKFVSVSISGPSSAYTDEAPLFSISVSGGEHTGTSWDPGGGTLLGQGLTSATIRFSTPGQYTVTAFAFVNGDQYTAQKIVNVYNRINPGVIQGPPETSDCYSKHTFTLSNVEPASGGDGTFSYQWQKRGELGLFEDIPGATGLSYTSPTIFETTSFKRVVFSGGVANGSNTVTITIHPSLIPGAVSYSGSDICPGESIITPLTNSESPSGGTGTYSYEWRYLDRDLDEYIPYPNSNAIIFTPTEALYDDLRLRRYVFSGPCEAHTTVTVDLHTVPPTAGTITLPEELCYRQPTLFEIEHHEDASGDIYLEAFRSNQWMTMAEVGTSITVVPETGDQYRLRNDNVCETVYSEVYSPDFVDLCLSKDRNYIHYITPLAGTTGVKNVDNFSMGQRNNRIEYYDGLGRPMQQVIAHGSGGGRLDIVTPMAYDAVGRTAKEYLPYVEGHRSGSFNPDGLTMQPEYVDFQDQTAYTEKRFERSPRQRVLEASMPGYSLSSGMARKQLYEVNSGGEVRQWAVGTAIEPVGDYGAGQLSKRVSIDEDGRTTIEYTDKQGRTLVRKVREGTDSWAQTEYIYDVYGQLRLVLPPEACTRLEAEYLGRPASEQQAFLDQWAYQYVYDHRDRVVRKQVPGADLVYLVYDARDRLVLTQDGNQRNAEVTSGREWTFTKYDALNRPVASGIYVHATAIDQQAMQQVLDTHYDGAADEAWFEVYEGTETHHGYTNRSFPTAIATLDYETITYYDHYRFREELSGFGAGLEYEAPTIRTTPIPTPFGHFIYETEAFSPVKGQVTGNKVRIFGSNTFVSHTTYYDEDYRVIQTVAVNPFMGSTERLSHCYSFTGLLMEKYEHLSRGTLNSGLRTRYEYEHIGRLRRAFHEYDEAGTGLGEVLMTQNNYNGRGELIEKNLHLEGGQPHQSIDYRYNIRGWLESINNAELTIEPDRNNDDNDLFGMELYYQHLPGTN